jgi:hypothetical protein
MLPRAPRAESNEVAVMPGCNVVVVQHQEPTVRNHASALVPESPASIEIAPTNQKPSVKQLLDDLDEEEASSSIEHASELDQGRFFYGKSIWTATQLQREIEEGTWITYYPEPHELQELILPPYEPLTDMHQTLSEAHKPSPYSRSQWQRILTHIGGELAAVAQYEQEFDRFLQGDDDDDDDDGDDDEEEKRIDRQIQQALAEHGLDSGVEDLDVEGLSHEDDDDDMGGDDDDVGFAADISDISDDSDDGDYIDVEAIATSDDSDDSDDDSSDAAPSSGRKTK